MFGLLLLFNYVLVRPYFLPVKGIVEVFPEFLNRPALFKKNAKPSTCFQEVTSVKHVQENAQAHFCLKVAVFISHTSLISK